MLRRADSWEVWGRTTTVALVMVLLTAVALSLPTIHALAQATAFTSDAVFRLPVRPLSWVTQVPTTQPIEWPAGGRGLLTLPSDNDPHPGLILVLGADAAPPDDKRVKRLTESLARIGFAVLLTQSDELDSSLVLPLEIPKLVSAFESLESHPLIRPDRIGYIGLSVGGSLAIVAAAQPEIAADVDFVVAIGPYYDALTLAAAVVSHSFRHPKGIEFWEPATITSRVVRETLLTALPEAERTAIKTGKPTSSKAGGAIVALLNQPTLEDAETLLTSLNPKQQALLESISPRHQMDHLQAPLYLLHDRNDGFIPWVESEKLAMGYEPSIYHRLDLFNHVDPDPSNLRIVIRDGWRLLRLFTHIIKNSR
jgi:hypothetical protein